MRRSFKLLLPIALLFAPIAARAQAPTIDVIEQPQPGGDAPSVEFNQTGVFEPLDLERITLELPREGTIYITFQRRFVVTGGSATRNVQMDFTFSSIVLRHSGVTPGNANLSVRMVDGRTVFISMRSLPKPGDDRYAYIR